MEERRRCAARCEGTLIRRGWRVLAPADGVGVLAEARAVQEKGEHQEHDRRDQHRAGRSDQAAQLLGLQAFGTVEEGQALPGRR